LEEVNFSFLIPWDARFLSREKGGYYQRVTLNFGVNESSKEECKGKDLVLVRSFQVREGRPKAVEQGHKKRRQGLREVELDRS
jgi:hypothetical protein